jgi:RHS repeat-associated protein
MNPGNFLGAGGGGGGGGSDSASEAGGNSQSTSTQTGGKDAVDDQRTAPDPEKYPTCGTESHPVDVVTGRVFTHPITDLALAGPLPFVFQRSYSSSACQEDRGLGFGWAHSLGWSIEVGARNVTVLTDRGVSVTFALPEIGHSVVGDWGWLVRRDNAGFALDVGDQRWRIFSTRAQDGRSYLLDAVEDRNGNRVTLTYDGGKLSRVTDSAGRVVKVTATPEGRIASLEVKTAEHRGRWIAFATYAYDDSGRLVRVTDADGHSFVYEYDEHNRLVRDTDRAGLSFCFRYDEKDRGIEAWGEYVGRRDPSLADDVPTFLADGRTRAKGIYHRKIDYHSRGYTEVTDTTETRRYFGNKWGTLDKAVAGGAVISSKYDEHGFEIEKTDALGSTWRWVRDGRGRVLERIDPLGRRMVIDRDAAGLPVRVVDPAGGVALAWRDSRGNLELIKDAAGGSRQFKANERGLITTETGPTGATTQYAYDAAGNLAQVTQPNGGVWTMAYDGLGRLLSMRGPLGAETRHAYTDRGDLVATYDPAGGVTRYAYDGEGHLTQVTSPQGQVTHLVWGGYHKLCARRDANGHVVRLAYSREGRLVAVVNEREELHRFTYDRTGQLVGEETFDGSTLRYRNDAAGRLVRIENGAGEITELVYDAAGQLIERHLSDDTAEVFAYDARGDVIAAANASGEIRLERDALGRVVREVQNVAGEMHWVQVAYDLAGNRVSRATSLEHTETVERDAMGARRATVFDGEVRVTHEVDALTRETHRRLPEGGVLESEADALGRVTRRVVRSSSGMRAVGEGEPEWMGRRDDGITEAVSYAYSPDGELVDVHDRARGSTHYAYDPVGQLVAVFLERQATESFHYDPAGNVHDAQSGDRTYGKGNRLVRRGDVEYAWDEDGRLTECRTPEGSGLWRYGWNGAGLLDQVDAPSGSRIVFSYDAFGRRVEKRILERDGLAWRTARRTRFVWDGQALVHETTWASEGHGEATIEERTFCYEDTGFVPTAHRERSLAGERPARWVHYFNSPGGAPRLLVDARGQTLRDLERTAWGDVRGAERTDSPLGFQGQYRDEETGLHYNRMRYYDPASGRFISRDPLGLSGGTNGFAYAKNPISWIDPLGLSDGPVYSVPGSGWPLQPLPGVFTLNAHGNAQAVVLDDGRTTDPKKIAAAIRAAKGPDGKPLYQNGMPIRLGACNAGRGENSIAEQLSKEMGVHVFAPNGYLGVEHGAHYIQFGGGVPGKWKEFGQGPPMMDSVFPDRFKPPAAGTPNGPPPGWQHPPGYD